MFRPPADEAGEFEVEDILDHHGSVGKTLPIARTSLLLISSAMDCTDVDVG